MMITIIIPTYQEEKFITDCLDSILKNNLDIKNTEILIVDGMSTDNTRIIINKYLKKYSFIKLIDNPDTYQSYGLNRAIKEATGDIIIRCDAHCIYPENYIAELIKWHKNNAADNIGGIFDTTVSCNTLKSEAIASVLNHPAGVGLSYRSIKNNKERYTDTVPFGSFKKELFKKIGLFDENFIKAEDLEFNIRLKKAGGRILMLPWLKIKYYCRDKWINLRDKFYQYGFWKNMVNKKHKTISSIRQLFPILLILLPFIIMLFTVFNKFFILTPFIYFFIYITVVFFISLFTAINNKKSFLFIIYLCISFITTHFSYGIGYFYGFIYFFILNKKTAGSLMKKNTR